MSLVYNLGDEGKVVSGEVRGCFPIFAFLVELGDCDVVARAVFSFVFPNGGFYLSKSDFVCRFILFHFCFLLIEVFILFTQSKFVDKIKTGGGNCAVASAERRWKKDEATYVTEKRALLAWHLRCLSFAEPGALKAKWEQTDQNIKSGRISG